jgi:hypothetical protein
VADYERTFRLWVGGAITALWGASMIVDMFNPNYDPPGGLSPIMLAVASAVFAKPVVEEVRRRVTNGED